MSAATDFVELTEVAGDHVTSEQVERLIRRYQWASSYCHDKDVLELACGSGQGLGLLSSVAATVVAGDYSAPLLGRARSHYGERIPFLRLDATLLPFGDSSFDVVVLFEAIYYLSDVERFFFECRRVLRPGGHLLIATANKDLFDFNPSPQSHRYLGVVEMGKELEGYGFSPTFFGDTAVQRTSWRQRLLRPAKAIATRLGLVPKSMDGKKLLKRLVFGQLQPMPAEISADFATEYDPHPIPKAEPDRSHKVLFCSAYLPVS